jgi:hypothetical protein
VKKGSNKGESEDKPETEPKRERKKRVSNTTILIVCVAVPLLLGGFANYFAHKWWILYFPLAGALLLLGYAGHLAIRAHAGQVVHPEKKSTQATNPAQVANDRAWLNVEVVPGGAIYHLPQQSGMCAFFPVTYRVTNTGRSPATDIKLSSDVFFRIFGEKPIDRQRQIASGQGHEFRPSVVFPATTEEFKITYVKPVTHIKECGTHDPGHRTPDQVEHFDAYVGGCVRYTSGGRFPGETGFLYEITIPAPSSGGNIVPEIGKDIPVERLAFRRYFFGGGEWAT